MSDVQTRVGIIPEVRGASRAADEIAKIYHELRNGKKTVGEANTAMREYSGTIYSQRRAISLIKSEYRTTNAALMESMSAMRAVARAGRAVTGVYQTYSIMQIRTADALRDVRDTEDDLRRVSELRIRVSKDLGENSVYALDLMEQERRLKEQLQQETMDYNRAQKENIVGYVGMGLAILDVVPAISDLYYHYNIMKSVVGESIEATGLTGIAGAAAAAKAAIVGVKTELTLLAGLAATPIVFNIIKKFKEEHPELMTETEEPIGETPAPSSVAGRQGLDVWDIMFGESGRAGESGGGFGANKGLGGDGGGVRGDVVLESGGDVDVDVQTIVSVKQRDNPMELNLR
jgi:hypothetical protein